MRSGSRRWATGLLAVALVVLPVVVLTAAPAGAAAKCSIGDAKNPDGSPDLTGYLQCQFPAVVPNPAPPGGTVTVNAGGFEPGSSVNITLECAGRSPVVLGSATADDITNILSTVTIPADTSPGDCSIVLSGVDPDGQPLTVVLGITISAAGTISTGTTTTSTLPRTGSDIGQYVGLGVALIALGGAAVWGARRERSKQPV